MDFEGVLIITIAKANERSLLKAALMFYEGYMLSLSSRFSTSENVSVVYILQRR